MKVTAGIVAASALLGAMVVSSGLLGGMPGALPAPGDGGPTEGTTSPIMDRPATVNPYNGMQTPEEVYEFTQKPRVVQQGDKWVITFTSKGMCDATVAILDGDGKVIRHLASGVLGKNAPWPFQQNSLSQVIDWDGLKDDFSEADISGVTVRVSLGLKPEFERSMLWDPNELNGFEHTGTKLEPGDNFLTAEGDDGTIYVIDATGSKTMNPNGRAYDRDGKYLRTFFPPPAAKLQALMTAQGYRFATTIWDDKVVVGSTYGFLDGNVGDTRGLPLADFAKDAIAALETQPGVGEITEGTRPEVIPPSSLHRIKDSRRDESVARAILQKFVRIAVDRVREEVYFGYQKSNLYRISGATGELDLSWFPKGELTNVNDCHFGPDGLLYLRIGLMGYGQWVIRLQHDGTLVPFGGEAVDLPGYTWPEDEYRYGSVLAGEGFGGSNVRPPAFRDAGVIKTMWTGDLVHSNTHARGLYVSPNGMIVAPLLFQSLTKAGAYTQFHLDRGIPNEDAPWQKKTFVGLMDTQGRYYTANAVGDTYNGHNAFMDRDGNTYSAVGGLVTVNSLPFGIKEGATAGNWGGVASLVKFQWKGETPLTTLDYADGMAGLGTRPGTRWIIPGCMPGWASSCTCFNNRSDMDYWARTWISSNYLGSVVVVDANGNMVSRIGRYGNVDDADAACGKIHFGWIRAVAVSDEALYVIDTANRRILKAKLSYVAEETAVLSGNHAPVISDYSPETPFGMLLGTDQVFEVWASDDDDDDLTYSWQIDGVGTGITETSMDYTPGTAGSHAIRVTVSDGKGGTATHTWAVTVTDPNNDLPTCSITSPSNGATFAAPATVTINASASDSDGSVTMVEFYQGSTRLGEDTSSPYSLAWSSVAAGSYSLTARATDNDGATKTSAAVSITVSGSSSTEIIVDNLDAAVNGAWLSRNWDAYGDFIDTDYLNIQKTAGVTDSVTFTPNLPTSGEWEVYHYNQTKSLCADNVKVVIAHAGGTSEVTINQKLESNRGWTLIGTYTFNAGTSGSAAISNGGVTANRYAHADAMKFVFKGSVSGRPRRDFDGDGKADILWRETAGGKTAVWTMDGATRTSGAYTSASAGGAWAVAGVADLSGDGKADILWRDAATGKTVVWTMDGATRTSGAYTSASAGTSWAVAGVADFDGDGKADILWRDAASGKTVVWTMDGATRTSGAYTSASAGTSWAVAGVADFDGDGKADILWRETAAGKTVVWTMDGATRTSGAYTSASAGTSWAVAGVADFSGDGKADILWREAANGKTVVWTMDGASRTSGAYTSASASTAWTVAQVSDFSGDGKTDILWRDTPTGKTVVWTMDGAIRTAGAYTSASAGTAWAVQ